MASLEASLQAAGGDPPPLVPDPVVRDNAGQEAGGNVEEEGQEAAIFVRPNHDMISTLPAEVLSHIISFLPNKDHISLTFMNLALIKAVEAFSREKYEKILEKYREKADETWQTRIEDQDSIKTKRPKPLELPFRYLLKKSLTTHLYVLNNCHAPCPLPDGKRLVGIDAIDPDEGTWDLCLWDLETKQSIPVSEGPFHCDLLVCNGLAVCTCRVLDEDTTWPWAIVVRHLDGELVHRTTFPQAHFIRVRCAIKTKVFFTARIDGSDMLCCLDIVTGEAQQDIASFPHQRNSELIEQVVALEDALMVLCRNDGIYAFDINDFSKTCFWPGSYQLCGSTSNSPDTTVVAWQGHAQTIDVLTLCKDGLLLPRNTFSLSGSRYNLETIIRVHQSLVFVRAHVRGRQPYERVVAVYNILNGELVRTISSPDDLLCRKISTNECELFCGMHPFREEYGDYTFAFPLHNLL